MDVQLHIQDRILLVLSMETCSHVDVWYVLDHVDLNWYDRRDKANVNDYFVLFLREVEIQLDKNF